MGAVAIPVLPLQPQLSPARSERCWVGRVSSLPAHRPNRLVMVERILAFLVAQAYMELGLILAASAEWRESLMLKFQRLAAVACE